MDTQAEKGDLFLRTLGDMKGQEKVKVESRPTDSVREVKIRQNRNNEDDYVILGEDFKARIGKNEGE